MLLKYTLTQRGVDSIPELCLLPIASRILAKLLSVY